VLRRLVSISAMSVELRVDLGARRASQQIVFGGIGQMTDASLEAAPGTAALPRAEWKMKADHLKMKVIEPRTRHFSVR
jgi:hypothetical protein